MIKFEIFKFAINRSFFTPSFSRRVGVRFMAGALLLLFGALIALSATPVFTNANPSLPGFFGGSGTWGDYDNDGRLDFLLTGYTHTGLVSRLYRNEGNGTFTWNTNAGLQGVYNGSVAWGDYDNDGRLDILLTGEAPGLTSTLYHNNGDGTFTDIHAGLPGVHYSSVAWGDYDNDGWLDFLLTGITATERISRLYHNNGDGTFTDINAGLPGVYDSSVAWGDYDNDGKLDFLLSGHTITGGSGPISRLYHNNGDGTFTDSNAGLPGAMLGSSAWGDYDNDGRFDILLTGVYFAELFHNDGNDTFTDINAGFPGLYPGFVAWGDYDNDGRLDFLLTGGDSGAISNYLSHLYHNNGGSYNSVPGAPTDLSATVSRAGATLLSWSAATDAQTPTAGLTYNLRVGITPGGCEIVSPQANPANGFRLLPQMGNRQQTLFAILKHLPAGIYHWSVQTIDSAYAGSPFAAEASFAIVRSAKENLLTELIALRASGTDQDDGRKLDEAVAHLTESLAAELWVDETHLERKHGEKVFREEKETVKKLCDLIENKKSIIPDALLQRFIDQMFRIDRLLASLAIQEAIAAGVSGKKIEQAQKHLARGDAEAGDDRCANGIDDYRNAWKRAAYAKVSAAIHLADGHMHVEILGEAGEKFTIQVSSNLRDWLTIGTHTANEEGIVTFEDTDTGGYRVRYYRALSE